MGCYKATLKYLETVGSTHLYKREPMRIYFHQVGKDPLFLEIPSNSGPILNLLRGLFGTDLMTTYEKLSAVRMGLRMVLTSPKRWERFTCAELFRKCGQSENLIRKFWEPMAIAVINASIEKASAVLFLNFFREAFLAGSGASDFLTPTVGLSELLIDPAIIFLQKEGVRICESTPVRSIESNEGKFVVHTDSASEEFDSIIYTAQTTDALPSEVKVELPNIEFSPIINAYFWIDRPVFRTPIHAYLGTTLQWSFTRPSTFAAQRLALTVSAGNELVPRSNEEIKEILWNDLCSSVPEMSGVNLLHYQIIKEKRATPLITPDIQRSRPEVTTNVPGLFLGGDIVQNGLPGTIEGAIRNGYRAAEELIRSLS